MSRSYKEPYWVEGNGDPTKKRRKRRASKKVRRTKDLDNDTSFGRGKSAYKKVYQSWDICDYSFYSPDDKKAYRK